MARSDESILIRLHLAANRTQFVSSLDTRFIRHHRGNALDAIAERAERLCLKWGGIEKLNDPAELTILAGAAHLSLVVDLMQIGHPTTVAYRNASIEITRALMGEARRKPNTDPKLLAFCDSITERLLTVRLQQMAKDWSRTSVLSGIRAHLGINRRSEDPFTIRVIDADEPPEEPLLGLEEPPSQRSVENEEELSRLWFGHSPQAWVSYLPYGPVMFLRRSTAEGIIASADADSIALNDVDVPLMSHEYVHTQRNLSLDGLPGFGHDFNEILASDAAAKLSPAKPHRRGTTYSDTGRYLDVVSLMTDTNIHLAIQEFGLSQNVDAFYQSLAASAGLTAMTLMASGRPFNYGKPWVHTSSHSLGQLVINSVFQHRMTTVGPQRLEGLIKANMLDYLTTYSGAIDFSRFDDDLLVKLPDVFQTVFEHLKANEYELANSQNGPVHMRKSMQPYEGFRLALTQSLD